MSDATTVGGTPNSIPGSTFVVEFFANPSSTHQGKTFIGEKTCPPDPKATLHSPSGLRARSAFGVAITATATHPDGNTSELSAPKTMV